KRAGGGGVKRDNVSGAVTVHFEGRPHGLTIRDVTLAEGTTEANAELSADARTAAGDARALATGTCGEVKDTSQIKIMVGKARPVPEPGASPLPGPSPQPQPKEGPSATPEPRIEAKPSRPAESNDLDLDLPEKVVVQPG